MAHGMVLLRTLSLIGKNRYASMNVWFHQLIIFLMDKSASCSKLLFIHCKSYDKSKLQLNYSKHIMVKTLIMMHMFPCYYLSHLIMIVRTLLIRISDRCINMTLQKAITMMIIMHQTSLISILLLTLSKHLHLIFAQDHLGITCLIGYVCLRTNGLVLIRRLKTFGTKLMINRSLSF